MPKENRMWKCEECGEEHENQFETCWKCESYNESTGFNNPLKMDSVEDIKSSTKIVLIICTIIFGIAGAVTFYPLLLSGMIFDAPGSDSNPINWVIFISLFTFAPMCIVSIFVSWGFYSGGSYGHAKKAYLLPVVNILALLVCAIISEIISFFSK
ncbi:hypothetical protein [Cellvibrio sp. KY-YJ-3]|uniref:hypothetical protein n=1 Tax=Cellvibrio sp. KY-YJ-3 TaxID=454662 RepID=UPI0012481C51|nr:hypothetical protein [Cellvibrio sp. KY-YJ-3]